jgi:hypothetical protein
MLDSKPAFWGLGADWELGLAPVFFCNICFSILTYHRAGHNFESVFESPFWASRRPNRQGPGGVVFRVRIS